MIDPKEIKVNLDVMGKCDLHRHEVLEKDVIERYAASGADYIERRKRAMLRELADPIPLQDISLAISWREYQCNRLGFPLSHKDEPIFGRKIELTVVIRT